MTTTTTTTTTTKRQLSALEVGATTRTLSAAGRRVRVSGIRLGGRGGGRAGIWGILRVGRHAEHALELIHLERAELSAEVARAGGRGGGCRGRGVGGVGRRRVRARARVRARVLFVLDGLALEDDYGGLELGGELLEHLRAPW